MSDVLQLAQSSLWAPTGVVEQDINRTLGRIMSPGIDYADLYFQYSRQASWALDEGTVKSGNFGIDQGVGVRAVSGDKTGFAYSDEITGGALLDAASAARSIAASGQETSAVAVRNGGRIVPLYQPLDPLTTMADEDKVALLRQVESFARGLDNRITQVMVSLAGVQDTIMVARSDGLLAADVRPLVRMNVSVIVEHNGRREQGSAGGGGRYGMDYFIEDNRTEAPWWMTARLLIVEVP